MTYDFVFPSKSPSSLTSHNTTSLRPSRLQAIILILFSFLLFPIATFIFFFHYARSFVPSALASRRRIRRRHSFGPKAILITGVGTTKGLILARSFYEAGHDVIGADFEPGGVSVNARFSRSLKKFYSLEQPNAKDGFTFYLRHLLRIVQREKVDLWVSCSSVTSAVEDAQVKAIIERRSTCIAVQFDVATTSALQDKRTFVQRTRELGLPVLETHEVASRAAVHKILHSPAASKKQYIIRSLADSAFQADETPLPRRTMSETYNHISTIPISSSSPWVLQEYIRGKQYFTHALIISNAVKTFVVCPTAGNMHLTPQETLPPDSPLSLAMRRYTQEFVGRHPPGMTGHLNFVFLVQEKVSEKGLKLALQALKCDSRVHTAVMLYSNRSQDLAEAYLSALRTSRMNGNDEEKHFLLDHEDLQDASDAELEFVNQTILTPVVFPSKYNWVAHDIVTLLLRPFPISAYFKNLTTLLQHLMFWKDAIFVSWDPLPWWWFNQVYWPWVLLTSIWTGSMWSNDGDHSSFGTNF